LRGALATLDPASGAPLAGRVTLATAIAGRPVFLISQLSGHSGALEADPHASLLVGREGRGDPLARTHASRWSAASSSRAIRTRRSTRTLPTSPSDASGSSALR
jgi:putative heme iron utilization protein